MWNIWNKQTDINGISAESFLTRHPHLKNDAIVYIKIVDDKITQVEGKHTLAIVYGIDETLDNDRFITEYERMIAIADEGVDMVAEEVS